MKKTILISYLLTGLLFIGLLTTNGCGGKGDNPPPPPPNPCAGITILVTGTVTNTTTGASVGAINATASGSSSFTYSINGGTFQTSGNFTGLAAGSYTIVAKNTDGCTGSRTFTVNDPCSIKNITVSGTVVNTTVGGSNGSIAASASGSTGFTYNINGGAFQGSGTFTGLGIGAYTIVAKDFEGCLKSQVFNVQDICVAKNITVSGTVVNAGPAAGATNGSISASASGIGSTSFTYQLNSGLFQVSGTFTGLAAGAYTVTAKDQDGCLKSQPFTIILDPCVGKTLTISGATTSVDKCAVSPNGTITITAGGGVGFNYSLNGGAFQLSNLFTGLVSATYNIAARDVDGCIKTGTATVSDAPAGTTFSAVRAVLQLNCAISGCHVAPAPQGGLNFTIDCTIVGAWDRIKARAVDANPSQMPPAPNPALSAADKQKILDWIAAGHRFVD
jgi:SprB repeat